MEEKERERRHQLELKRLELEARRRQEETSVPHDNPKAKIPNLPKFIDGKDELDSYLLRFERFAKTHKWDKSTWASSLSALLTGNALQVYGRLSDEAARDYDTLKKALYRRYDLTEEGFRRKFRETPPEEGESPEQFITKLSNFLKKWMELSNVNRTFEDLRQLIVKEQFINAVSPALEVHLKEKSPADLEELAKIAEQYLTAHGTELFRGAKMSKKSTSGYSSKNKTKGHTDDYQQKSHDQSNHKSTQEVKCYKCSKFGHTAAKCKLSDPLAGRKTDKRCLFCDKFGHDTKDCRKMQAVKTSFLSVESSNADTGISTTQVSSYCKIDLPSNQADNNTVDRAKVDACIKGGKLQLANGYTIPCMNAYVPNKDPMPVTKGRVGQHSVQALRDTGCSGIVVKEKFVDKQQYTGAIVVIRLADNTFRKAPVARIHVDTPFLQGEVDAVCLPDAAYDILIGNVPGARPPSDPDPAWQETCAVTTRAQTKQANKKTAPLIVPGSDQYKEVSRDEFLKLQQEDETLTKYWNFTEKVTKGRQVTRFERKRKLLYRIYEHPNVNRGNPISQILVPTKLRKQVIAVAHESILGGHLCAKKTKEKILSNFYWPGMDGDVTRFCRSCDICQKTISKGKVTKVPLEKLPIIDTPFKRVSIDIIGKIYPPSEKGHQFILTMMDHASRYPDAVPLKNIDTETVAEALVDMFSRVGVPEEVLSDLGTQFTSDCMKEVSRLLSIRQLTTSPYHPMCNGLVERFNGTLKQMLKRLCAEKPKQWHRYINAILFAYREIPQDSTGFSPFEVLFGRTVRGLMHILKELWTKDIEEPDVKNSYQYVFELRERMEETMQLANNALQKAQGRYKHYYDKKARPRTLEVGDQVLILLPTASNKLLMQWKGPFTIEKIVSTNDYGVNVNGKVKTFHINMLKKYLQREDTATACAGIDITDVATIQEDPEYEKEDLLEMTPVKGKESIEDIEIGDKIEEEQKHQIIELIREYEDIFTDIPGTSTLGEHKVELTTSEPIRSKPYPVPHSVRESLKKDIQSMLDMSIIRKSSSPYASPVVIVQKPDGSNRICIDYRKLNRVTVFDPEPMVTADDLFAKIGRSRYFTKLDFTKGYWQIKVRSEDIPKTAFVTPDGQFEFLKMPFGMVNAGATYVRSMRSLLKGLNNVESYIDDVLVHTATWHEHLLTLRELFQKIRNANLTVRPTKCTLATDKVDFIGHNIEGGTLGLQDANIHKIRDAPRPTTKKEVRSFLGLTGFYRAYIPNYATVAAPLTDLTRKGQSNTVKWQEPQEKAYMVLKSMLVSKPVLRLPDLSRRFILRTDASDVGLGAMLMQEHEDGLFPVSFASRKLLDREKRYSTMEKECLAIVWAVKKFILYLYGVEFTLQTDHQPLTYLNKTKFVNDRIMRWAMFLQNYRIRIEAIKGCANVGADYLSRVIA